MSISSIFSQVSPIRITKSRIVSFKHFLFTNNDILRLGSLILKHLILIHNL
ncbi:hypothetical protein HanRHA438_Chr03g0120581 [Helianthus annuus]|nr:hypothetical protein HanIR_Chr03g0117881 [Helianthus annuus]KAJ0935531.1 hypothetical protein HanRHA438_Chr03g0120581 [Helianthus annuus]